MPDPTPANRELELQEDVQLAGIGAILINEIRAKRGLPPVKGGWSMYMPVMNVPVGGLPQSESKGLIKVGDDTELKVEAKRYDFSGRSWLKNKLEIKEEMARVLAETIKEANKNKIVKEETPKGTSYIKDEENKKAYADFINKKIDLETGKLKNESDTFFGEQGKRVTAKLEKQKSQKKITVNIEQIFDEEKEFGLTMEFISPHIAKFLEESAKDALKLIAPQDEFEMTKKISAIIKKRAETFARETGATTIGKLKDTLAEGIDAGEGIADLTKRVNEVYSDFPNWRSELIARTEATNANNQGTLEGFRQSDVTNAKEWINAGDDRVRPEHDNGTGVGGEIVKLDEKFSNGLMFPSEPNCRCVIGPAFLE
jgi:SPP1 gp7 family putative phage head morphogenesis protein